MIGAQGLLERYIQAEKEAQDAEAREFYACVQIVIGAFLEWSELHAQKLEEIVDAESKPARKSELVEMIRICRRVPRFPASSFREAIQAFWFQHLAVMFENPFGGNGPGRLDFYLWPYLERDLDHGRITMVHDCLERGRSMNDGGARYPHYGGSAVGIPNVGDSLYAIKQAVFDEKSVSGEELYQALCANFQGYEELRKYLLNMPKYGSEDPEADAMTERVLQTYCEAIKSHRNPHGGHCRPIILGFVWVVSFGQQVGATPDGRFAGQALAHSLSPQSGSAVEGLTAAINSATSFSLDQVSGGASMMWDLDVNWVTPEILRPVTGRAG